MGILLTLSLTASPGTRAQSIVDLPGADVRAHFTLLSGYLAVDLIYSLVALMVSRVYLYYSPLMFDWATGGIVIFLISFALVSIYNVFIGAPVRSEFHAGHGFCYILSRSLKSYGLWFDALFPVPVLIVFFGRAGYEPSFILVGMMLGYIGWYGLLVEAKTNKMPHQNLRGIAATCIMVFIDSVLICMLLF